MSARAKAFMAVATFRDGVTLDDIRTLVPAEQARAANLKAQGCIGDIRIAMPRRTVFIEVFDDTEHGAQSSLDSLPLAALWDVELYETTPPAGVSPEASHGSK